MVTVLVCFRSVFKSNMGQQINTTTAALSGYRVLVNFNGTNQFIDNLGGGVVVSESRVNVMGTLVMNGNYAVNGGGLAMFGRCLVRIPCTLHQQLFTCISLLTSLKACLFCVVVFFPAGVIRRIVFRVYQQSCTEKWRGYLR